MRPDTASGGTVLDAHCGRSCSQDFHVAEAPEGSVHQAAEAVPLHLQGAQGVQAVERQALHPADAVPAQLPGTSEENVQILQNV